MKTLPAQPQRVKNKHSSGLFGQADNLKIAHKGIILVAVPLITGLIAVGILLWLLDRSDRELRREARVRQIHLMCSQLNRIWMDASVTAGAYAFTKEQTYKDQYNFANEQAYKLYAQLAELVKNSPEETKAFAPIAETVRRVSEQGRLLVPENDPGEGRPHINFMKLAQARANFQNSLHDSNRVFAEFRNTIDKVESTQLLDPVAARDRVRISVINFGLLTIIISSFLAAFFSRSITNRLMLIKNNAVLLASRSPLHERLSGRDEIAQLDSVFHQMAFELKETGVKSRAITDNAVDIICAIDAGKRFVEINPACRKTWGYAPEDLIGKRFADIIAPDDVDRTIADFNEATSTGDKITILSKVRKSDESFVHMQWSLLWSPEKKTYFCIAHDVSARHKVEQLKKDFVSMVSHDLRTPLTSLQGSLALFESGTFGDLNEKGVQTVNRSIENLTRLINLIDSLLDIEKMEAGKMHLSLEVLDVAAVVTRSVDAVAHVAEKNGIEIRKQTASLEGYGDAAKLIQVVVNLLSNAIKFSPKGSVTEISYLDTDEYFEVKVKDQGRGIPESHLAKVFSRFEQVESADHTRKGGKGLGLAICKSIVEGHGGKIGVESREGQGSTFWFRIPHPQ